MKGLSDKILQNIFIEDLGDIAQLNKSFENSNASGTVKTALPFKHCDYCVLIDATLDGVVLSVALAKTSRELLDKNNAKLKYPFTVNEFVTALRQLLFKASNKHNKTHIEARLAGAIGSFISRNLFNKED